MKYTKDQKIRIYKTRGKGKWTSYTEALDYHEKKLLIYAVKIGYALYANDAPRQGKHGEHFLITKDTSSEELESKRAEAISEHKRKLEQVLPSQTIEQLCTISDIGSFKINGKLYSNFYGDGMNSVEVCTCKFDEFLSSTYITKRQVYNPKEPITIVKYDKPQTISVSGYDVDTDDYADNVIENVCGFAIWERKLKVFVAKNK